MVTLKATVKSQKKGPFAPFKGLVGWYILFTLCKMLTLTEVKVIHVFKIILL